MIKKIFILFIIILCTSCKDKIKFQHPKELGELSYMNTFEDPIADNSKFINKKNIHNKSICFTPKDSTIAIFSQNLQLNESASISLWFRPEFYGVNGTIITLSDKKKDYPINSVLSIYMNKNRIAVMQNGKDLRKMDYDTYNDFTDKFMAREELNVGEMYFLTYTFQANRVSVFVDGKLYSEYDNVPTLEQSKFVTLGASWNNEGTKYHFKGCIDDLYIYNGVLESHQVNQLMEYTHIYYELDK